MILSVRASAQLIDRVAANLPEKLKVCRLVVALVGIGGVVPISIGPAVGSLLAGKPTESATTCEDRGDALWHLVVSNEQAASTSVVTLNDVTCFFIVSVGWCMMW